MSVLEADCVEAMRELGEASVDSVVTDPPYGLGFMGKAWDSPGGLGDVPMRRNHSTNMVNTGVTRQGGRQRSCEDFAKRQARDARSFQEWSTVWTVEAFRVLKPGGHLLAFGGTRTYHRLACAVEDAGFEIRDTICWLYGSGFPKSHNLPGGLGTALKPAHEPVVVARKPLVGTVARNVQAHGTGALNIDGCRVDGAKGDGNWKGLAKPGYDGGWEPAENDENPAGRWPANVALDPESAAMLDDQSGELTSGRLQTHHKRAGDSQLGTFNIRDRTGEPCDFGGDSGGASRFFYCAKTSRAERNAGLDGFAKQAMNWSSGDRNPGSFQAEGTEKAARNPHPTVKPVALMRWLVRLVTPPAGLVLDPFCGSGTTGIACVLEGFDFAGIEREPEYVEIARARIAHAQEHGEDFATPPEPVEQLEGQEPLWDEAA